VSSGVLLGCWVHIFSSWFHCVISWYPTRVMSLSFCLYHQATVTQRYRPIRPRIFDELGQGASL
jgi:hypothetical protein